MNNLMEIIKSVGRVLGYTVLLLALSILAGTIVCDWVADAAFSRYSKTRVKKIKKKYTWKDRMLLRHLSEGENPRETKKRIRVYWGYWGAQLIMGVFLGIAIEYGTPVLLFWGEGVFLQKLAIDVVIFLLWKWGDKKKRTYLG